MIKKNINSLVLYLPHNFKLTEALWNSQVPDIHIIILKMLHLEILEVRECKYIYYVTNVHEKLFCKQMAHKQGTKYSTNTYKCKH